MVSLGPAFWYVGFCALLGQINSKAIFLELTLEMLGRHGLLTARSEPCCLSGGGVTRLLACGDSPQGTMICEHVKASAIWGAANVS